MTMQDSQNTPEQAPTGPIVARAGGYYRNARYIMFGIIVAMGCWFFYDGMVTYPNHNKKFADLTNQIDRLVAQGKQETPECQAMVFDRKKKKAPHEEFSIRLQKLLGVALPPIGLGLMIFWLRQSRGQIRLENGVLYAPGHPPVPLAKIDELDKQFWERKGICYAYYDLGTGEAEGKGDRIRLDDFVYQAQPIRDIVKHIEDEINVLNAMDAAATTAAGEEAREATAPKNTGAPSDQVIDAEYETK